MRAKGSAPARPAAKAFKDAGLPKGPAAKGALRLVNPANVAARLYRMTAEQREQALEPLPPRMQENLRKQLTWFDGLSKEQQVQELRRMDRYGQLTPEKQAEVRELLNAAQQLPPPRKGMVRQALARLENMPEGQRAAFLASPRFKNLFTTEEQRIITGLADGYLPRL